MVYFGKKQGGTTPAGSATLAGNNTFTGTNTFNNPVVVPQPANNNEATNKEYVDTAIGGCAKLASANTFTADNTFNNTTTFHAKVNLVRNNNGAFLENFEYANKNYTSLKFFKNNTTNLLQIEANTTDETVNINSGTGRHIINIDNIADPTTPNQAANKYYVDNIVKYVEKAGGLSFTRQVLTAGEVNKYYATVNFSDIPIPNGKKIISCYCKAIPVGGAHLVITFFPGVGTNQCLIEIYQYKSSTDITNSLNGATYCFTYLNV